MAKVIMVGGKLQVDPRGKALDKRLAQRRELQDELDSSPSFRRRRELKKEIKALNENIRIGTAIVTGIDPGRIK